VPEVNTSLLSRVVRDEMNTSFTVTPCLSARRAIDLSWAGGSERRRRKRKRSSLRFDEVNRKPIFSMVYPRICCGAWKIHGIIKGVQPRFHASNRVNRNLPRGGIWRRRPICQRPALFEENKVFLTIWTATVQSILKTQIGDGTAG